MSKEYRVLNQFLKANGYKINVDRLELEYLSHPDKPDLVSFTETLDVFEIEHLAAEVTKDNLDKINNPFIAHLIVKENQQFCLVRSIHLSKVALYDGKEEFSVEKEKFIEAWDGIVLCIDSVETGRFEIKTIINPILFLSACLTILFAQKISAPQIVYYSLAITGVLISLLIIQKEMGVKNSLAEKFCGSDESTGCNKIIGKKTKFLGGLSIGDISLAYFLSDAFIVLFFPWNALHLLLSITGLISMLVILVSIGIQGLVEKTWCRLCLVISGVLVCQILASSTFTGLELQYNSSVPLMAILFGVALVTMYKLKSYIIKAIGTKDIEIENMTFRKNYKLFDAYMDRQNKIDTTLPKGCFEICIGSPSAKVELVAISNPMCGPCSKAHGIYDELLEKYSTDILLKIRFYVPYEDRDDPRTQIAAYFLQFSNSDYSEGAIKLLLQKWYEGTVTQTDLNSKRDSNNGALESLRIHKEWCLKNGINQTPTLLINGKKFPSFYRIDDLKYYMDTFINNEKSLTNHEYISSYSI